MSPQTCSQTMLGRRTKLIQRKINFPRILELGFRVPALTQVLSQYELLDSIARHLSSADIVHLSATCKEHPMYITSSKSIHERLKLLAVCDGKGIIARARVFAH